MNPDQTAQKGTVGSWSILFATKKTQQTTFAVNDMHIFISCCHFDKLRTNSYGKQSISQ